MRSKQEPVPVRAFNLMKMEATNVLFPWGIEWEFLKGKAMCVVSR